MNQEPLPTTETAGATTDEITLLCPHCDYNLAGLPVNRCPEYDGASIGKKLEFTEVGGHLKASDAARSSIKHKLL